MLQNLLARSRGLAAAFFSLMAFVKLAEPSGVKAKNMTDLGAPGSHSQQPTEPDSQPPTEPDSQQPTEPDSQQPTDG